MNPAPSQHHRSNLVIVLMVLFLTLGIGLAALTAVGIMQGAALLGGPLEAWLLDKGADRVMRRCIFGWGMVFLAVFLKRAGWRGWRDSGLSEDPTVNISRSWRQDVSRGIILGLLSLGAISVAAWWTEARVLTLPPSWNVMPRRASSYLASGVVVGLLEEIICRGVLFRLFKRLWRFWPAAIFSSALFAMAHFLSPHPDAFIADSSWAAVLQVYLDTFAGAWRNTAFLMRLTNLTLLGMVLCAFLEKRGSIWLSVGAHAGWVWIIKFHAFLTMANPARPIGIWFGERADFTDGLLATALMITLLIWGLTNRHTTRVRQENLTWHVDRRRVDDWRQWLSQHTWERPGNGAEAPGRTLKAYDGCRVSCLDGLVIKARWPRSGWSGRRFAWRRSRARRNFYLGRRLRAGGLPTPAPLAWCIRRRLGLRRLEYLITDELRGARPLAERLATAPAGERARIVEAYGALMARFHRMGYANRDFKHENVMAGDAPDHLWVVDLDGVRRRWPVTRRRAGRDLGRVGGCLAYVPGNGPDDTKAFFKGYNALASLRLQRSDFPPPP